MPTYRISLLGGSVQDLPSDLIIKEEYPAFVIVSAAEDAVAPLRSRYPVEQLGMSRPAPDVPAVAELPEILGDPQTRGPYTLVIRFHAPVRQEWIDGVEEIGCTFYDAIGSSTLVIRCPNKPTLSKLQALPMMESIGEYRPHIALSESFLDGLNQEPSEAEMETAASELATLTDAELASRVQGGMPGQVVAHFFSTEDAQLASRRLKRQGIQHIAEIGEQTLLLDLTATADPEQALQALAQRQGLKRLEEKSIDVPVNDVARKIIAERITDIANSGLGLTGKDEIIAVADSGLDTGDPSTIHDDFNGRVRDIRSFPVKSSLRLTVTDPNVDKGPVDISTGHGTHVSGSILGNGTKSAGLSSIIQGIAPEAELVFQAVEQTVEWNLATLWFWSVTGRQPSEKRAFHGIPDNIQHLFSPAYDLGARIHNNSWGGGGSGAWGAYNQHSYNVDEFVWNHRDFLVVAAAGNEGNDTVPIGAPGSVTPPGTAKNCLTVGASQNARPGLSVDRLAVFSGRGPTSIGRRKPDVVAPGDKVLSTRSSQITSFGSGQFSEAVNDYMFMNGTSMATPLVSGCATLARQYLRTEKGFDTPSAALLKATIIHSARYIEGASPHPDSSAFADNEQGWGRVDLQQVLNPLPPTQVIFIDDQHGIHTGNATDFQINLSTSDAPLRLTLVYTDYPGEGLINNLNLFAVDPDGSFFIGNDFNGSGGTDSDNNVEGIIVENPKSGIWRIRVEAFKVPRGPQDFALVISGGGLSLL